jgi:hypothetical protein
MILSDREIREALDLGHIVIRPAPDELHYASTSVDLRLADRLDVWAPPAAQPGTGEAPNGTSLSPNSVP